MMRDRNQIRIDFSQPVVQSDRVRWTEHNSLYPLLPSARIIGHHSQGTRQFMPGCISLRDWYRNLFGRNLPVSVLSDFVKRRNG